MKPRELTEQDIIDRAARRARRWFWLKVWILILIVALLLVWVTTRRASKAGPVCDLYGFLAVTTSFLRVSQRRVVKRDLSMD
jgi:hypothetical protein